MGCVKGLRIVQVLSLCRGLLGWGLLLLTASAEAATYSVAPEEDMSSYLTQLQPGDTLLLKDGTYAPVSINCNANARNGTASAPITLKAEHERRAWLKSDGGSDTIVVISCSYWRFEELRVSSQDNAASGSSIVYLRSSHNNVFQRNLLHHSNRLGNNHMVLVGYPEPSNNNVFIENEFYHFHRYALITVSNGSGTVARRNYCNARGYATVGYSPNENGEGDACIQNYPASDGLYENNIAEQSGGSFSVEPSSDSIGNRFLGNISIDPENAAKRPDFGASPSGRCLVTSTSA